MAFDTARGADRCCRCTSCIRSPRSGSPSFSRYGVSPAFARYSVTTFDPGARLVFTQGLRREPLLDGLLREQPGRHEDARVRRIRAARDRGDDDRPVRELDLLAVDCRTHPSRSGALGFGDFASSFSRDERKSAFASVSLTRSCGRVGPARLGTIEPRSRCSASVYLASGAPGRVKEPLRLAVRLDELHLRLVAPGEAQVPQRHVVDREDAARGAVLRRHVRDRRAIGEGELRPARRRRTRRTCRRRPSCEASR